MIELVIDIVSITHSKRAYRTRLSTDPVTITSWIEARAEPLVARPCEYICITMSEITELLSSLDARILNALARKLGADSSTTRKADVIAALDQVIRCDIDRIVEQLSNAEKKLLAEAAYNGGRVDTVRFAAKYGEQIPLPRGDVHPPSNASPLLLLIGEGYGPRRLPKSLAEVLQRVLEKPPEARIATTETLPTVYTPLQNWRRARERAVQVHESERTALAELRAVLRWLQAGKVRITDKGGRPTGDSVRFIAEKLVTPDFQLEPPAEESTNYSEHAGAVRAHAWGVLVQQCGWAKARGGRLHLMEAGRKLLDSGDAREFAGGVKQFLVDDEFDELQRINHIRGQFGGGRRYLTSPGQRRVAICKSIAQWPVSAWIDFSEVARFTEAAAHSFQVTEADYTLYFEELQYGTLSGQGAQINRQYLRAFLFESLATLGLIDVAYVYPHHLWPELRDSWGIDELSFCSRYDGLLYVRLNALGAYCLGITDRYTPAVSSSGGAFRVLSNREVALLDNRHFSAADRHFLELFAVPKNEHVWALDTTRILSQLESGGSLEELRRFLEVNSTGPIPGTVQAMLTDLASKSAAVAGVEDALLIEFRDEITAALITHDAQAGKYCYAAGDRRVAVPKKNRRAFRSALLKLGFVIPSGQLPD
jgi:hypothetical protein